MDKPEILQEVDVNDADSESGSEDTSGDDDDKSKAIVLISEYYMRIVVLQTVFRSVPQILDY